MAVSSGQCVTCLQKDSIDRLCGAGPVEFSSGSAVELKSDGVEVVLGVTRKVCSFGQVLADEAVGGGTSRWSQPITAPRGYDVGHPTEQENSKDVERE
jgi:hypothetical protein